MADSKGPVMSSFPLPAGGVVIRRATVEDVDAVAEIERLSFPNPWPPDTFRSLIHQGRALLLVAADQVEVVGYAVAWWVMEQGELANVAVKKEFRGKGIGGALLDRVLRDAREAGVESLFLEVRVSNRNAQVLYASRGFNRIAVRRGYYQNPEEDAWILLKHFGTLGEG